MEIKTKQVLLSVIAAAAFIIAGIVLYYSLRTDSEISGKLWVKCLDTSCMAEYEMDQASFFKELGKNDTLVQSVKCQKCGKQTAFPAMKCPKCGILFHERSDASWDYADRCPKCKFSQMETDIKSIK